MCLGCACDVQIFSYFTECLEVIVQNAKREGRWVPFKEVRLVVITVTLVVITVTLVVITVTLVVITVTLYFFHSMGKLKFSFNHIH